MYKRFIIISILFSFTRLLFAAGDISITAYSAILMRPWDKKIIYSKNPHIKLAPASTTKIMTAIVVVKNSSLEEKVRISAKAASMPPSKIHLREGERYSIRDLLMALLLNSGNDAGVALAEHIAGSEEAFVRMMNNMARRIGARHTRFKTSTGLPARYQYSTAYDLALIVREAMRYKIINDIMKMKIAEIIEQRSGRRIRLKNHNKGLFRKGGHLILGKTGYTIRAGHCFAGYIMHKRQNTIVVVLRSRRIWKDLTSLAQDVF